MNVFLYDDEIAEVHKIAYDLYKNPRTNPNNETFAHKLRQQIKGALCEKAVRIATHGAKAEVDGYHYDVVCHKENLLELGLFKSGIPEDQNIARIEVKHFAFQEGQRFITFHNSRIFHARKGAKEGLNDILFVVSIDGNINISDHQITANVNPVGVFQTQVLCNNRYIGLSQFTPDTYYLKEQNIRNDNVGVFFGRF